jgi:hypothetical protein
MKIKSIECIGKQPVFDISVKDAEHYVLSNGVVTHNTGIMLASDNVWIVGRSQDKGADGLDGYFFTINIEKSRYVREKSKIPINVRFEGGMSKYSGLLDIAMEGSVVIKPSNGWYSRVDENGEIEAKKWRAKDTDTAEFWDPVLKNKKFIEYVENRYKVSNGNMMTDDDIDTAMDSLGDDDE